MKDAFHPKPYCRQPRLIIAKHGSILESKEGVTLDFPKAHEHKNNVMNKMRMALPV